MRTEFTKSYTVTNFTMKDAFMKIDVGTFHDWWNKFQFNNMNFYNHGLNECNCDNGLELSVLENVNLNYAAGTSSQYVASTYYWQMGLPVCSSYVYAGQFDYATASSIDYITGISNPNISYLRDIVIFPPDYGNIIPRFEPFQNDVTDLFSNDLLNPSYETSSGIQSFCIEDVERKGKVQNNEEEMPQWILAYPSPSYDKLTVLIQDNSKWIVIKNIVGEIIDRIDVVSSEITFDLSMLSSGLYFVSDDQGNTRKFIINR